jgi:hypothetical protein
VLSESRLDPVDERVAFLAGQRGDEELHYLGVRVHPGERLPIIGTPRTQQQPISPQHLHIVHTRRQLRNADLWSAHRRP